jgi:pimeloyl-ACP methyl ester carboxylesterase
MTHPRSRLAVLIGIVGLLVGLLLPATAAQAAKPRPAPTAPLPIVFVHGQSGSAQQFETNAMRFTSNGYPRELLYAFEYDTSVTANPLARLDAFLDEVRAETGADKVLAVGHSRGTSFWTTYLNTYGGAKVAKYVNIDGARLAALPGGVPTIGIWGEWNSAGSPNNRIGGADAQIGPNPADNFHFPTKGHTETATSAEAFALMYRFFTGQEPATTDVLPEPPGQVSIAGRATLFPQNVGYPGATLELWRIDDATGQRIGARPQAVFAIDESGAFGPVKVNGTKHYELALLRPEDGSVHHFYFEPFARSNHFLRLNTSTPGTGIEAYTSRSATTTNLVINRQREFWGDQGAGSDVLTVDGLNVLTPATSARSAVNLAFFTFDAGLDGTTDLARGVVSPFHLLSFLTAADVHIPASADGSGTVSISENPRGSGRVTTINVPNWPSSTDRISVQFSDADQAREAFPGPRG